MGAAEELHPDLQGLIGTSIAGRYRVDELVGEGGMGAVFRGHHLGLKRDVAIKVLHPDMTRDAEISARFDREAHSASRLDHPNCLQVTDVGVTESGLKFMVMQLLEGRELAQLLGVPIEMERSLFMMLQVLRGLEHAHDKGVIHRDIKPENVFITTDHEGREIIKLVDFGIAKLVGGAAEGQRRMTKAGLVFGTPAYMSPEQALGVEVDGRADLYSVGIILYEMLNGRAPFMNDDPVALVRMQVTNAPPPLPEHVPQLVVDFIWRLLEKQREDRFQSATEAREALERIIPMVVSTDVIVAAGFAVSGSGTLSLPTNSGLLHLPGGPSGPVVIASSATGPIRLRATSQSKVERLPHERVQTLGRLAMEPPPPGIEVAPRRRVGRWLAVGGILAIVGVVGFVASRGEGPLDFLTAHEAEADADDAEQETTAEETRTTAEVPGPDVGQFAEIDKLILSGKAAEADKLLGPLLDAYPDNAQLVWRHGRLFAQNRKTRDKALAAYGRALDLDPTLVDDHDFYDELGDLLRVRALRDEALDIALRKMGPPGHKFLLELVNNERRPLGHSDRHRALDTLAADPANVPLVNWRLNKALDLLQATQSLTPCQSYAKALEAIAAEPDPWYIPRVEHAPVPTPQLGEKPSDEERADAAACEGLDARRTEVLAMLAAAEPVAGAESDVVVDDEETGGPAPEPEVGKPAPAPAPKPAPKKTTSKKKSSGKKRTNCSAPFMGLSKKCR